MLRRSSFDIHCHLRVRLFARADFAPAVVLRSALKAFETLQHSYSATCSRHVLRSCRTRIRRHEMRRILLVHRSERQRKTGAKAVPTRSSAAGLDFSLVSQT